MENVLAETREILIESERVFCYGNMVMMECGGDDDKHLVSLMTDQRIEAGASGLLSNLLLCESTPNSDDGQPVQFAPPKGFVEILLTSEPTIQSLPMVDLYVTRPVFDDEFNLLGPGWHPDSGVLVHGPQVDPVLPATITDGAPVLERLPRHLRRLLSDFCFKTVADLVNALAVLLTALLITKFVMKGKPIVLLDGNQPSLGKTLLAVVIGIILDGMIPKLIRYTPDDQELAKTICSTLRSNKQNVVAVDNAKARNGATISSPTIESNSTAPQVSLRILGRSMNYTRPNDLIWILTMNSTRACADMVSRGVPVQFHFEGDPRTRDFADRDPAAYAMQHRTEILGELAGMVIHWNQRGRPPGTARHRCVAWAQVIGGILQANGFPEFLQNLDEAAAEFNSDLDELAALAEAAVLRGSPIVIVSDRQQPGGDSEPGLSARELELLFRAAKVLVDRLDAAKGRSGKSTVIGNYLSAHIGREMRIEVNGRSGRAKLCMVRGRSNTKQYYFEIRWDDRMNSRTDQLRDAPATLLPAMGRTASDGNTIGTGPPERSVASEGGPAASGVTSDEPGNTEAW